MVPDSAYLVDEDRLPKILDEFDDCLGVLRLIQDPSRLSLPQQRLRPFLNVFQGSTKD